MNKKEIKLMRKIRKMLGYKEYHLCEAYEQGYTSWKLYKTYEGWLTDNSKPILTNENTTLEELYEFAKKRYVPDLGTTFSNICMIILIINCISAYINCYLQISFLRGVILTIDLMVFLFQLVRLAIAEKKCKILYLHFQDQSKALHSKFEKENNENETEENEISSK